jgi:Flp pilus assembly protein TadB
MQNSAGWNAGSRKRVKASGLRRHGFNLIGLGAFALVAAPAVGAAVNIDLLIATLILIGIVMCLVGWRMLVIARRREHSPTSC